MRVAIIEQRGAAVLVEWRDGTGLHRAIVPGDAGTSTLHGNVRDFDVRYTTLEQGVSFGMAFERLEIGTVGAASIARELHERGIWTADDVRKNVAGVRAALLAAYGKDLEALLNAARAAHR